MGLQAKNSIWFVVSVLAVYLLLSVAASSLIHPYFRDAAFYAVEILLATFLLFFFAGRLLRARSFILLAWMCVAGYLLGATSYLIKWIFLDHRALSMDHLAQIKSSILSGNLWFTAVFTYCWVLLPLAVFGGRWIVNRLGRTVAVHQSENQSLR
jgi:hypothetical protein